MWATDYIPDWAYPATKEAISGAELRLGVTIPPVLKKQLAARNGGQINLGEESSLFLDNSRLWTNAIVDGIHKVESWETAAHSHWFQNVSDGPGRNLLVIIAAHSESHLCLDFRLNGPKGVPSVTFIDVCMSPKEVTTVVRTVDEFVAAIIKCKGDV